MFIKKHWKIYNLYSYKRKRRITRIDKNGKKSQKIYLTHYSLLIAQNLSQADYEILSVNFVEEFIKLNINTGTMIKKCETCGIK